jgi:hypothetical protein
MGFYQVELEGNDREKAAFSVNHGKYEFARMLIGLKNSPFVFQRVMDDVLIEHIGKICHVYINYIIDFGKNLKTI